MTTGLALSERVAVVTGGGGAIGAAISRRLDQEGAFTYVVDVRAAAAQATLSTLSRGSAVSMDVSDSSAWEALISEVLTSHGRLDILVNNAATHLQALVSDTTDEDWDRVIRTNAYSVFYGCRAVLAPMKAARRGAIVNIVTGQFGVAYSSAYTSSKFLVQGFSQCLALEVARWGVRVNTVSPGVVPDTGMNRFYREKAELLGVSLDEFMGSVLDSIPLGRFGTPEDVADAVLFLVSDAASYITGHLLDVGGGFAGYASAIPRDKE